MAGKGIEMKKIAVLLLVAALGLGCATTSPIREAVYDANHQKLIIQFADGSRYVYADVPERIMDELRSSESRGRYFNHEIRSKFEARRLSVAMK